MKCTTWDHEQITKKILFWERYRSYLTQLQNQG